MKSSCKQQSSGMWRVEGGGVGGAAAGLRVPTLTSTNFSSLLRGGSAVTKQANCQHTWRKPNSKVTPSYPFPYPSPHSTRVEFTCGRVNILACLTPCATPPALSYTPSHTLNAPTEPTHLRSWINSVNYEN